MPEIVIATNKLTKCFGSFMAVDGLSMEIAENTVHGFLGPNGSGKTTAIRMMCGLLDPTSGTVNVLGLKVPEQAEEVRLNVGYMTQRFSMYQDMTVRQNLNFLCRVHGMNRSARRERIAQVTEEYGLSPLANRFAGQLSGGQKRRLALAGAVLTRPKLLILDEPTSEVDPNTRREMWEKFFQIASAGTSILTSTHLMDEAERCHNLTILNRGCKVADGSVDELKNGMKEKVVVVNGPNVATVTASIKQAPGVISAMQVGLQLRVILDEGTQDPEQLVRQFAGQAYTARSTAATIEDVFMVATGGKGSG